MSEMKLKCKVVSQLSAEIRVLLERTVAEGHKDEALASMVWTILAGVHAHMGHPDTSQQWVRFAMLGEFMQQVQPYLNWWVNEPQIIRFEQPADYSGPMPENVVSLTAAALKKASDGG